MKPRYVFEAPQVGPQFSFPVLVRDLWPYEVMPEISSLKIDGRKVRRVRVKTAFLFYVRYLDEEEKECKRNFHFAGSVWFDGQPFMIVVASGECRRRSLRDAWKDVQSWVTDPELYFQAVAYLQRSAGFTHRKVNVHPADLPCQLLQELYGEPNLDDLVQGDFLEDDDRPRPGIRPADLYALPGQEHPWGCGLADALQSDYHQKEVAPELEGLSIPWEKNERVEVRNVFFHNFDGRRTASVYTLWVDGRPFMIVGTGGRDCEKDHAVAVVTDEAAYFEAVAYLQNLAGSSGRRSFGSLELVESGEEFLSDRRYRPVDLRRGRLRADEGYRPGGHSLLLRSPHVVTSVAADEDGGLRAAREQELAASSTEELVELFPDNLRYWVEKNMCSARADLVVILLCHEGYPVTAAEAARAERFIG